VVRFGVGVQAEYRADDQASPQGPQDTESGWESVCDHSELARLGQSTAPVVFGGRTTRCAKAAWHKNIANHRQHEKKWLRSPSPTDDH
jgi:hypothetical protein